MAPRTRRYVLVLILLLAAAVILLMVRCTGPKPVATAQETATATTPRVIEATPVLTTTAAPEVLTSASIQVPAEVSAGAAFQAIWTGPNNPGDYLTIVPPAAHPAQYQNYRETRLGTSLELSAPIEAGEWEVRYVTARSKTILGRVPLRVTATSAVLTAVDEVVLGAPVSVTWSGPNHAGDFICIVPKDDPDDRVGSYGDAIRGSPLNITAPVHPGEAEIRYVSGQGRKVLGRRKLMVLAPDTSVTAQASAVAGEMFAVTWTGPGNKGDYITVVPRGTPDGQYRNYADTSKGSPLELTAPMETGEAEIRYMTGKQARVLARRSIHILAANVGLEAADEVIAGASVRVNWTGPNNANDYVTIVPATTPDGQYGNYTNAAKGSPLQVTAPIRAGAAEIRYMSGQGAKVLARRSIAVVPAQVSIQAPAEGMAGSLVAVDWKGPNNAGDYLTLVPRTARDGTALQTIPTTRGTPAKFTLPKQTGSHEIRYMSGQGSLVLARAGIEIR